MASLEPEVLRPELEERLDGMVRELAATHGVRHAIVAVGRANGSPLWVGASGLADEAGAPMTPDTPRAGDRRLDTLPGALRSLNDLYSTVGDLLWFMASLVSGEAFDDATTSGSMTAHWNPLAFSLSLRPTGPEWPMEYGLGAIRFRLPRCRIGSCRGSCGCFRTPDL
jgi:hypothetical protein